MELKNRVWMTGSLEWYAYIDDAEVYLGQREVPYPLEEGDRWTNQVGNVFEVRNGEILLLEQVAPPERCW